MGNQGGVYTFSQVAAQNSSADSTQNWAEGMAPSAVNDSARALLASIAKYRDDLSGMLLTGGTSNAYSISSNQQFDSLTDMHQKEIWFTPHVTNTAGSPDVTVTIDSFANIPIRSSPNTPLVSGVLVQGTPYGMIYNNTDKSFYLKGYFGNVDIPFLSGMDYWDTISPGSQYIFPNFQAISRTVYARAFARWGTQFGAGDGSTTFNVPPKAGRVSAMLEATPTLLPTTISDFTGSGNSSILGAEAGSASYTQARTDLPNVAPTFTGISSGQSFIQSLNNVATFDGTTASIAPVFSGNLAAVPTPSGTIQSLNGGVTQTPMRTVPPIIMCNYIIRVL